MDAVAVEAAPARAMLRVFVAEDSRDVVHTLADLLAVAGRAQVVATTTTEAESLDWAARNAAAGWDLAIVDLVLDQGSGFNVIRRLRQSNPTGRIVVFSAFVSDVIRRHCHALGADLVLGKEENAQLATYLDEFMASP